MIDLILYCSNTDVFDRSLVDGEVIDEQGIAILTNRTPRSYSTDNTKFVTLVRVVEQKERVQIFSVEGIEVLGTKEEVDADASLTAKYLECYNRTPYTVTSEDGTEIEVIPPYWHGEFA